MCTAVTRQFNDHYFGRTLDHDCSYGESVTLTPRNFPLPFRNGITLTSHFGILGIAHVADGYPLYYDAVNDKGLAMAGLHFVGNACYTDAQGPNTVAQFEVIPWVLSQCITAREAVKLLQVSPITKEAFRPDFPPAPLHWLLADRQDTFAVEMMADGLHIEQNPIGVLTNNPPFQQQLNHLADYQHLSPGPQEGSFGFSLPQYSRGMGALGLPGDLSSKSRFVRAAFTLKNSILEDGTDPVSQMFHILGTVAQTKGCCRLESGSLEFTRYTSCCNATRGIYYYTTYGCRRITAVAPTETEWVGSKLIQFSLRDQEDIRWETAPGG